MVLQEYLLNYLAEDEKKHNNLLARLEEIKKGMEELTKASYTISEMMYKEASKKQAEQQGAAGGKTEETKGKEDDVVDADYEDADDNKKK